MKKHIVKYLAIAMSLALLLCLIPGKGNNAQAAVPESANLLAANGIDYTIENFPLNTWLRNTTGWNGTGWSGTSGAGDRTRAMVDDAYDGGQYLLLRIPENSTGANYIFTPKFSVPQTTEIRYSVDYLAANGVSVWVQYFAADGTTVVDQKSESAPASTTWTTYTMTSTVPAGAVKMHVGVSKGTVAGDYCFDNFVVERSVAMTMTGLDNLTYNTYVYDSLNIDFEDGATRTSLQNDGWSYGSQASGNATAEARVSVETVDNTAAFRADNRTTGSVLAVFTPAIDVSGMDKVLASVDVYSSVDEQCYVVFVKADGTSFGTTRITSPAVLNAWGTHTCTIDVPAEAVYARIALWKPAGTNGVRQVVTYYDNIRLTAATTTPATTAPATTAPATTAPATTAPATSPDTGDNTALGLMIALMTLSVVALVATKAKFGTR